MEGTNKNHDIFISYSHANMTLVAPILAELERQKISYFIDQVGIDFGSAYGSIISDAIRAARMLLLIWTEEANKSPDVQREVVLAEKLKKPILPYRVGNFDPNTGGLAYHLAPLSRYDAAESTPETVVELVKRLKVSLGKVEPTPIPVVVLPTLAEDMKILEPTIDDINIAVVPVGPSEEQEITSNVIQLPPIPSELVQLRAEIVGIDEIIEDLRAHNHPALAQAQQAIQTAQAQADALAQKKEETWDTFERAGGDVGQLEEWIQQNPKASARQARHLCPQSLDAPQFVSLVIWGQKCEQARRELARVQGQYEQKRKECIDELVSLTQRLAEVENALRESAIFAILAALPGYDTLQAPLPEQELAQLLPELKKYEMGWDFWDLFDEAEALWDEKRPVVLAEPFKYDKIFKYEEVSNEIRITGLKDKNLEKIFIPAWIHDKRVTEIGVNAFENCSAFTRISIPSSVTKIGRSAFSGCRGLISVTIPSSVTEIGMSAFSGCRGLISVTIPSSVTEIGEFAFSGCSGLTSVTIPASVTKIGDYAFYYCRGLTSITIPASVTEIGDKAFKDCPDLTIETPQGSYAEQYAKEKGIKVITR